MKATPQETTINTRSFSPQPSCISGSSEPCSPLDFKEEPQENGPNVPQGTPLKGKSGTNSGTAERATASSSRQPTADPPAPCPSTRSRKRRNLDHDLNGHHPSTQPSTSKNHTYGTDAGEAAPVARRSSDEQVHLVSLQESPTNAAGVTSTMATNTEAQEEINRLKASVERFKRERDTAVSASLQHRQSAEPLLKARRCQANKRKLEELLKSEKDRDWYLKQESEELSQLSMEKHQQAQELQLKTKGTKDMLAKAEVEAQESRDALTETLEEEDG